MIFQECCVEPADIMTRLAIDRVTVHKFIFFFYHKLLDCCTDFYSDCKKVNYHKAVLLGFPWHSSNRKRLFFSYTNFFHIPMQFAYYIFSST